MLELHAVALTVDVARRRNIGALDDCIVVPKPRALIELQPASVHLPPNKSLCQCSSGLLLSGNSWSSLRSHTQPDQQGSHLFVLIFCRFAALLFLICTVRLHAAAQLVFFTFGASQFIFCMSRLFKPPLLCQLAVKCRSTNRLPIKLKY